VFKRRDTGVWQFVAGGGEDKETPLQAAGRETQEEAGIISNKVIPLKSICYVPADCFSIEAQTAWGKETIVIPVYTFAVVCGKNDKIYLSDEHTEYKWCLYENAYKLLRYDVDKTALYELNERLVRNIDN